MNTYQNFLSQTNKVNLVFIDSEIEAFPHILSGIKPDAEAFIINRNEDGVKKITQVLSRYNDIESIHIVSHGAPGTLYLGSSELSLDTFNDYAGELQSWFDSVSDDVTPALVLYGCNVAVGDAGSEFLEKLLKITKATIYASSTPVGNSAKGGNWDLDVCRGKVHNSLYEAFQSEVLETYSGIFATGNDGQYTYYDSKEGDKGTVAFTDISTNGGTDIRNGKQEEQEWQETISLPFKFRFYGKDFNSITVSDNGGIIFGPESDVISLNNSSLPNNRWQYSIFPFWDDLKGGNVYYLQEGDRFIVQWNKIANAEIDGSDATFQVVLHRGSNNIDFVYQDVDFGNTAFNNGADATIGINKDRNSGIQYSFKENKLSGITSIRFLTEPKLVNSNITVSERVEEQEKITLTEDNFKATDVSSSDSEIKFIITNSQNGYFEINGQTVTEFTQADIKAGNVKFVHNGGENAPSFDVKVTDGFNETVSKSVSTTSDINFTNVNDNPVLTGLTNSVTFNENALNQAAAKIYSENAGIDVTDADSPDFNGGNLTVTYQSSGKQEDQLSIANKGGSISLEGSNVKFNGTVIGNVDATNNGSDGKNLIVNFNNPNATPAAVKALIKNLTYQNTSDTPQQSRTISVTVNDGGDDKGNPGVNSIAVTTEIKVTAENDKPVNTLPQPQTINEDTPLAFTENNLITISDVDAGDKEVQVNLTATDGKLSFGKDTGLNFSDKDGNDGTLKFTGTVLNINDALKTLVFTPKADFNGETSITVDTQDKGNSGEGVNLIADNKQIDITVKAVNDPPKIQVSNKAVNVDEDTELVFNNDKAIVISDVDVDEIADEIADEDRGKLMVTVSVDTGTLKLADTTGIEFADGNSNGNAGISFKGKLAAVNAALKTLTYKGNQDFNGKDILTITTNDLENTGAGGPKETTNTVDITVNAVNDAPVNTINNTPVNTISEAQIVDEDTNLVFNETNNNRIKINDIDFDPNINKQPFTDKVEVTLGVTKGSLTLKQEILNSESIKPLLDQKSLEFTGDGTKSLTIAGKVADINTVLDGLTYLGDTNYNGDDTLTITTNDLGNTGKDAALSDTDTIAITINPINDAPINADVPTAQTVDEDTQLVFNTENNNLISISDIDVDDELNFDPVDELQVTLSVNKGTLNLNSTPDLVVENNNSAAVIVKGKVEDINTALNGLSYLGNQDFNGKDILKIEVNDLNNGAAVGQLFSRAEVDITVNAINDAPVNTISEAQTIDEDTKLVFNTSNNNRIAINDVDLNPEINEQPFTDKVQITLAVEKGTLNLGSINNLLELTGDGTNSISFQGTVADINAALDNLVYLSNTNYNGDDKLTITTNDLGNSGEGEPILPVQNEIAIKIKPVNDAPVNQVPQAQEVDEDEKLFFSSENGNALSLSDIDVDEGTGEVKVTLNVKNGTLTLAKVEGLTFEAEAGDGDADATMTFTGKVEAINQALDGMFYLGNKDFHGAETLTFTTDDQKNFGDVTQIDTDIINITVLPDSDADGVNDRTEDQIAAELEKQEFTDAQSKNLSKRATQQGGIAALYSGEDGSQPILIAIDDQNQQELSGSENPALTIADATIKRLKKFVSNPVTAFDKNDERKSSLKEVKSSPDIIDFNIKLNPEITDDNLQQQIKDGIKQKPVKVEVKLPDDINVNAILQRKADGTLYDLRREFNPRKNELEYDMLTGAVLQDRNLDGKADWTVLYLQDGEWGDEDGLVNGEIAESLVFANLDLGSSRMEVRSNRDGLNFYGNKNYVKFSLSSFSGDNASEIGMARVRFGEDGGIIQVNGKTVSSLDEAKQEIIQKGETLFSSLKNKRNPDFGTQTRTVAFEEGEQAVFFTIQDGTRDELLFNGLTSKTIQFSVSSLNSDGANIFQASGDESGQTTNIFLAGLFDIEAKILTTEEVQSKIGLLALEDSESEFNSSGKLIDLNSSGAFNDKQVTLKFSLQREAEYRNSAYLYKVDDAKGSILDPLTGTLIDPTSQLSVEQKQRYLELASSERLVENAQFSTSNFTTTEVSVTLDGGGFYAPFLVSDGTLSSIEGDFSRILTPYMGANSNSSDHIRNLGNGIFGFEDMIGSDSDRDFNDMILSITQVDIVG